MPVVSVLQPLFDYLSFTQLSLCHLHQFRESMLPDWQNIRIKPGVEVVTSVDGFGTPEAKIGDYRIFDQQQLIQYRLPIVSHHFIAYETENGDMIQQIRAPCF
jgi:hypothetical protein